MSFYLYKSKPNLIYPLILKHYNNKIKNKYFPLNIENKLPEKSLFIIAKENILNYLWILLKDYYEFFFIILLLIILLYIRYIEVNKKKLEIKKILEKINI